MLQSLACIVVIIKNIFIRVYCHFKPKWINLTISTVMKKLADQRKLHFLTFQRKFDWTTCTNFLRMIKYLLMLFFLFFFAESIIF